MDPDGGPTSIDYEDEIQVEDLLMCDCVRCKAARIVIELHPEQVMAATVAPKE